MTANQAVMNWEDDDGYLTTESAETACIEFAEAKVKEALEKVLSGGLGYPINDMPAFIKFVLDNYYPLDEMIF